MSNLTVKTKSTTKKATTRKAVTKKTTAKKPVSKVKEKTNESLSQKDLVKLVNDLTLKCETLEQRVNDLETKKVDTKKLKTALRAVTYPSRAADLI